jgi:POT family proton-dependent oligopeptide transporter
MNDAAGVGTFDAAKEPTWFGHPRGLTILFLTETWEKFSYYGMRAILVYYMTKQLMFAQAHASNIYGTYTMAAYFTPLIGGVIADRWLGRKRAVIIGGAIMALGHFMLAFESLLFPGLAAIAVGNGLFLPSLPSQVGSLYRADDPRRSWAYNLYYVGINVGAFLAPLVCGTLGETVGWHYGFAAAGVGMVLGLCVYIFGQKYLPIQVIRARAEAEETAMRARVQSAASAANLDGRSLSARFALLFLVVFCVVVFRGAYEQVGNTIATWIGDDVDRRFIGGLVIPATWFQSINPLMVFVLTPIFLARWARLAAKGREASTLGKMVIGAGVTAVSYLMVAAVSYFAIQAGMKASWLWAAAFFVLFTAGELYILPVGLGLFGRLAPPRLAAFTIAAWFFAISFGSRFAGWVGGLWEPLGQVKFFALMAGICVVAAILLFILDLPVRRMEKAAGQADLEALHLET